MIPICHTGILEETDLFSFTLPMQLIFKDSDLTNVFDTTNQLQT